jgi:hypothetical protein
VVLRNDRFGYHNLLFQRGPDVKLNRGKTRRFGVEKFRAQERERKVSSNFWSDRLKVERGPKLLDHQNKAGGRWVAGRLVLPKPGRTVVILFQVLSQLEYGPLTAL